MGNDKVVKSPLRRPADPADRFREHYPDLRRMASSRLRRLYPHPTLQTTELVSETYIRLAEHGPQKYTSRGQFFESAKRAMGAAAVDRLRRNGAQKRWGRCQKLSLDDVCGESAPAPRDFQLLHETLERLKDFDPALGRIVHLRYFEGFSVGDIAAELRRGYSTIRRDCAFATAWLRRELHAANDL